jgi:hypothetical protein
MIDTTDSVALLKQASTLLTEYRYQTGRPPFDDLTLYEWADSLSEEGDFTADDVLREAIARGVPMWQHGGASDHIVDAEFERAQEVIYSHLGFRRAD